MAESRDIEAVLYDTLAGHRGLPVEVVREDVGTNGVIDSLEGVELIIAAETHFEVTFADDEVTSQICRSIPKLATAVAVKAGTTIY